MAFDKEGADLYLAGVKKANKTPWMYYPGMEPGIYTFPNIFSRPIRMQRFLNFCAEIQCKFKVVFRANFNV